MGRRRSRESSLLLAGDSTPTPDGCSIGICRSGLARRGLGFQPHIDLARHYDESERHQSRYFQSYSPFEAHFACGRIGHHLKIPVLRYALAGLDAGKGVCRLNRRAHHLLDAHNRHRIVPTRKIRLKNLLRRSGRIVNSSVVFPSTASSLDELPSPGRSAM